jgi:GNAT superfamily N-acetyltransferase
MEDDKYTFEYLEKPAWEVIGPAIDNYNKLHAGDYHYQNLCFVLKTAGGEVVGGVIGVTFWDWLHIDLMWVKDELRGKGFGERLLKLVEEEARKRGARNVFLDTFSFQAPDFYKKQGYRIFGQLDDFPAGNIRYFLVKQL